MTRDAHALAKTMPSIEWPGVRFSVDEDAEVLDLTNNIMTYVLENVVLFINNTKPVEADWSDFLAGLDKFGAPRLVELYEKARKAF